MESALRALQVQYESTEPWVNVSFSKRSNHIDVLTRFSIALGVGPVVEFNFECREDEISNTLCDLVTVVTAFPYLHADA